MGLGWGTSTGGSFMQQHQLAAAQAAPAAPAWYLARGDKRYGPLGNRELPDGIAIQISTERMTLAQLAE